MSLALERRRLSLAAALSILASAANAQQPAVTPNVAGIDVGVTPPDFALPGATRYGVLRDPVRLTDYRGKTVVVAFFFKARTKG